MKLKKTVALVMASIMAISCAYIGSPATVADADSRWFYGEVEGIPGCSVQFDKSNGTITWIEGDPVDVVLPSEIDGVTVKKIGSNLFAEKESLESITIPSTVKEISYGAFSHTYNLEKIVFEGDKSKIKYDGLFVFTHSAFFNSTFSSSYKKGKYYKALTKVKLTGNYVEDAIKIGESQLGYVESNSKKKLSGTGKCGNGNYSEYNYMSGKPDRFWLSFVKNDDRYGGWCNEYCVWCYLMAGAPEEVMPGYTMYEAMDKGKDWKDTKYAGGSYKIKRGDLIHFEKGHYALVTGVKKKGNTVYIDSLNGNWCNDVSRYTYKINAKTGASDVSECGKLVKILPVRMDKKSEATIVKLTFDANGGNVKTKTKTVAKTSAYGVLPTPTKSGAKFAGWYTEPEGGKKIDSYRRVMLTEDTTVYAHWK